MEAIFLALVSVVNPGDEVLVPDPGYPNYLGQLAILGGVAVQVPIYEENNFNIQAKDIEAAITEKTKAIILNSPSNPLGSVLTKEALAEIAEVVRKHDLFVISDEVYEALIFGGMKHHSLAEFDAIRENVLIINSFSKTYAMTGWRIGYVVADEKIVAHMPKLQEGIASCLPAFIQLAAKEAVEHGAEAVKEMREAYARKHDLVITELKTIQGLEYKPSAGTFYAFVNIKSFGMTSQAFAEDLLLNAHVLVVPGSAFGPMGEGYIRLVFSGSDDMLTEAFSRIRNYLNQK
jgi:aminotransferase